MTTDTGTPGLDSPGPTVPPDGPARLTRSRTDRKVAGVCGGLGAYTGIDPVVFRVVAAVSAVLGGAGIVAYLLAWAVIPEATEGDEPPARRDHGARLDVLLLIVVGLSVLHLLSRPWEGNGMHIDFAPVVLAGAAWWWWRRREDGATGPDSTTSLVGPTGPAPRRADPAAGRLPRLTVSAVVVTAGVFTALAAGGVDVDATVALATCLLVAALGLLVSSWYGTRRGLLLLCGFLAVATTISGIADVPLGNGAGDRNWQPVSAAELQDSYRLGAGDARLDMSGIHDLHGTHHVEVSVGLGDLRVVLPADVGVTVRARAGAGQLEVLGRQTDGVHVSLDRTVQGDGDGVLVLDVRIGAGDLRVDR